MHKEVPASKELAPDLETIITEVSRYSEVKAIKLKAQLEDIKKRSNEVLNPLFHVSPAAAVSRLGRTFSADKPRLGKVTMRTHSISESPLIHMYVISQAEHRSQSPGPLAG